MILTKLELSSILHLIELGDKALSEHLGNQDPTSHNQAIAERVKEQLGWISNAAEIINGPGARVEDTFELPPGVRRYAPTPDWTPEQEAGVREISHKLGYGAEQNVPSGLRGGVRLLEGGLAWKIAAESGALADENGPGAIVFAGSPFRQVNEAEQTFMSEKQGTELEPGASEYDLAGLFARKLVGKPSERTVNFGYGISDGNPNLADATGQLVQLGKTSTGQPVYLLRVDREVYEEGGESKYRYQPAPDRLMGFISEALQTDSPGNHEPVGFMTSNAYASRQVDAVIAGLEHRRQFGVAMYGRATLAAIKGTEVLPDVELNQVPGDLRVTYDNLKKLAELVTPKAPDSDYPKLSEDGTMIQFEPGGPDFHNEV